MAKLNLKNKTTQVWAKLKSLRDFDPLKRVTPQPFRDWRRLMIGWLVGVFLLLIIAGYLVLAINQKVADVVAPAATSTALTQNNVTRAQAVIGERAERYTSLGQVAPILIDPAQ